MKKKSLPIIAIAAILGLASCGEAATSSTESGTASASTSEVSSSSAVQKSTSASTSTSTSIILPVEVTILDVESTELEVGATLTLEVDVKNNIDDLPVVYSSSDEGILTVENGVVTATGLGEATITVAVGEATDTLTLTTTMPSAMIGEWAGNDGSAYHELSIGKDGFVLDGEKLEVVETLALTSTGFRAKVLLGGANYILEYYVSPFTGEIYIEVTMIGESSGMRLYKEGSVEDPYPPLPTSWAGTYTGTRPVEEDTHVYTLVISSEGKATLDGEDVHCLTCDQVGAATVLIEDEEYTLAKLGDTITLSKTGEDFTLMLDKEEEGETAEPGVYEPEDATWLGTWTDGTHTLIVTEEWNWSLDGEMADKVWEYESGEIVLQFNGTGNIVTRYYLERTLIDGTDTVVVSSLTMGQDDYWHLVKEVAEPVTLPEEAVGEWVSDFAYAPTLVVNEDGSITLGGVTSTPEITDDGTGVLSWELPHPDEPSMILAFVYTPEKDGNPATISYNNGNIVYTKKDETAPIVVPDVVIGTWTGEDYSGNEITVVVAEDGTVTVNGEPASFEDPFVDDGYYLSTHIYYGGASHTFDYVLSSGKIYLGYFTLTKVEETEPAPTIDVPDVIIGTWTGEDFGGNQMTVVVSEDGTVTVNGEPASFEGEFVDDGTYIETDITYDGGTHSFQYVISSGELYVGFFTLTKVEETEPAPTIDVPDVIIGTWTGEDWSGNQMTVVVSEDGTVTVNGEPANFEGEFVDDGTYIGTDIYYDGNSHSFDYVISSGELYVGFFTLTKVEGATPAVELPDGIVGTWKDASTGSTIVIGDDGSITIDGEEATFVSEFEESPYGGSYTADIEVGGETKTLEFSTAFGSIYLDNVGPYKKADETTQTTFPAELIGTWTGTDTFNGDAMTLVIAEDGTVTYNGTEATSVTDYDEDIGLFTFVINGDQFRATVKEDVISHEITITLSCLGGLTMVQGELTKAG